MHVPLSEGSGVPVIELMGFGHSGFLVKPFELDELAKLIDSA